MLETLRKRRAFAKVAGSCVSGCMCAASSWLAVGQVRWGQGDMGGEESHGGYPCDRNPGASGNVKPCEQV